MAKGIKSSVGGSSCILSITPHKESSKNVVCEICDKVFETEEETYICP